MLLAKMKNFSTKIYEKLKKVPKSNVVTYKELAHAIDSRAYRAVGSAMKNNKDPIKVPCYKVIESSGKIGGYCGKTKGEKIKEKIKLHEIDGIEIKNNKIVNLEKYLYKFSKIR